ncbi:MAG TPA: hypothetical protein PKG48_00450 [Bacteroidales bacterium]|nr:hypothetical protein [Bacteroidales bacterium]
MQLSLFPFLPSKPGSGEKPAKKQTRKEPPAGPKPGNGKPAPKPATVPKPSYEEKLRTVLGPHVPGAALDTVVLQLLEFPVSLHVVPHRTSKAGDFRPASSPRPARITVNGTLNPYAFLITLVHEIAHHRVELDYLASLKKLSLRRKRRPQPHGEAWKSTFRRLLEPHLLPEIFPDRLLRILNKHIENPSASSSADHKLSAALQQYDPPDNTVRLEELPFDAVFTLHGRRFFRKKEKMRSRYRCLCLQTNRVYLVSAVAPVIRMTNDE